jgi:NAD(P)H-hydrate epimerase
MHPLLTAAEMRSADDEAINSFGIPSRSLMETAGRSVAAAAIAELVALRPSADIPIAVVCGSGNNGGDGFVAARALHEAGYAVEVFVVGDPSRLTPDARDNLDLLDSLVVAGAPITIRHVVTGPDEGVRLDPRSPVVIDALLGTGARGAARSPAAEWITAINAHRARVVSADIPSGLDADTGHARGLAVQADATITFGALKTGLLLNDGSALSGNVTVAPIGIPPYILRKRVDRAGCARLITRDDVVLPGRPANAHKYTSGLLYALCGSVGMTGAAVLACEAAMRVGAGAVKCAIGERSHEILARKLTVVMTVPLPEDDGGLIASAAVEQIRVGLKRARAVLVGCGCGRGEGTSATIRALLDDLDLPVVVDADALFALGTPATLSQARGSWVLTPHKGEFERLIGEPADWDSRIDLARRYAAEWGCVLLLKGLPSVVGVPDGRVYVAPSVSSSLATAGAGDVLAGMIAGYLAQGMAAPDAAIAALYVGGVCADQYATRRAPNSLLATDLLGEIPLAMRALRDV